MHNPIAYLPNVLLYSLRPRSVPGPAADDGAPAENARITAPAGPDAGAGVEPPLPPVPDAAGLDVRELSSWIATPAEGGAERIGPDGARED